MSKDSDDFWKLLGSIALGIIGGKVLLNLIKVKCEYCGFEFPADQEVCPICRRKRSKNLK